MLLEACRKAAGSAWNGLRRPKSQIVYSLPTELWEIIIDYALTDPFLLDTDCSPVNFYYFATMHRVQSAAHVDRKSYDQRSKSLGAVCRMWRLIIEGRKRIWVHVALSSPVCDIGPETRRVEIAIDTSLNANATDSARHITIEFQNVQVIALYGLRSTPLTLDMEGDAVELHEILNAVRQSGSSIHSFIYEDSIGLGPMDLHFITKTFPLLTTLTLHTGAIRGVLSIQALKILNICSRHIDISQWDVPSLHHLALGDHDSTLQNIRYESLNLGLIKANLLSLMVSSPFWVRLDASFWADHPSLQFLGVQTLYTDGSKPIHDARILCITGSRIESYDDPQLALYYLLSQFPFLTSLITPNKRLHNPPWPTTAGYSALSKYCSINGIAWYIGYDHKAKKPVEQGRILKYVKKVL
ncbi:hypothetical protein FRC17_010115 [Serendipita sp. 399]|nr:hypothetical protein FRC17_010115 [Serendipita sp. 399]